MISRRMFLSGSASTLWLPFLPSALPRTAWGAALPPDPKRLFFWFVPNGILYDECVPTTLGANYALTEPLAPILPIQSRVTVVSGIENRAVDPINGGHNAAMVGLLSDHKINAAGIALDGSVTVDQYAVQNLSLTTPFQSMQLGTNEPYIESFGNGNDDVYHTALSWANPQTPLAQLSDPKTVFDRMFAGTDPDLTAEDIARRTALRKSLLDAQLERVNHLVPRLSADDNVKLDQFTTGVRELELQIDAIADIQCETPPEPASNPGFAEAVTLMSDLIVVAYQCDFTRIITFSTGPSTALTDYTFLGITTDHHTLSHNQANNDDDKARLLVITNWHVAMWTALCEKLAAVPEGAGDMLSNTLSNLVTEFGQSNTHVASPQLLLVAGGEAGGILQGHHRNYGDGGYAPHSNLWWSELEYMGVDPTGFGENATYAFDLTTA